MTIENYILKRKLEDGLNEFDLEKRQENLRICVNYVFEFFNNYLDTTTANEKTILHDQKVDKYRYMLREYDTEVKEWLVSLYSSYGKYMHKQITNLIDDTYFLLYDNDADFRALSYEVYPKAVKKFKFLEGESEMVFKTIKEIHRIKSMFSPYDTNFYISEEINSWILDTYNKYGVNIYNFCHEWASYFFDFPDIWPKGHKKKSEFYKKSSKTTNLPLNHTILWEYDYKQKSNLFGLDSLYRNMPKKSFTKGKKQAFEATILYCWLHSITSDENYWYEYSQNVL